MTDVTDSNKVYYYHFDGLGSVVALSDMNNVIVESYSYDVFGQPNITSSIGNPYLFTGRRYDEETDLYYYRARYYDYSTGRFLGPDPIRYDDGMNMYIYCWNNPTNHVDPYGLKVYLYARKLRGNFPGPLGVHTYIVLIPDNPDDFGGRKKIILGGYQDRDNKLSSEVNNKTDLNWPKNKLKGIYKIQAPTGKADTEFIRDIINSFGRYMSRSRNYEAFPEVNDNEGNCHNVSTGALVGAGISKDYIANLNPSGANPGLGEPLPEMLGDSNKSCPKK